MIAEILQLKYYNISKKIVSKYITYVYYMYITYNITNVMIHN